MKSIKMGSKIIDEKSPAFIIAECGVNHNGNINLAIEHIIEAKKAGADAVKFQNYTAEKLVTKTVPKYWHIDDKSNQTQFELFSRFDDLPKNGYMKMMDAAKRNNITMFSTPFELEAVDFLETLHVPAYKIASADITYHQLLKKVATTGKPIILSTGASTIGEIEEAISIIQNAGNQQIALLHCTLSYPTKPKDANLAMIPSLAAIFADFPIGLSDHTFNTLTPALAVTLGAKIIEKHFTIDKSLPDNPDHKLGLNPKEFKELVQNVRAAEMMLGQKNKRPVKAERDALELARRSLVAKQTINKGTKITKRMIEVKRPGTGIAPKFMNGVIGRKAQKNIKPDTVLTWDMF